MGQALGFTSALYVGTGTITLILRSFWRVLLFFLLSLLLLFLRCRPLLKNAPSSFNQSSNATMTRLPQAVKPPAHSMMICSLTVLLYLEVRPVGGHPWAMAILPPAQVFLLVDGHQRVVELAVHRLHTERYDRGAKKLTGRGKAYRKRKSLQEEQRPTGSAKAYRKSKGLSFDIMLAISLSQRGLLWS